VIRYYYYYSLRDILRDILLSDGRGGEIWEGNMECNMESRAYAYGDGGT